MMPETLLPPDAVLVVTMWLRAKLAEVAIAARPEVVGVAVSESLPPARTSAKHIRVRRTGGVMANRVEDAPRIDFQVWHPVDRQQAALAALVRSLFLAAPGTVVPAGAVVPTATTIGRVAEFVGPNQLPDPVAGSTREIIQWTAEVRLRVAAI